MTNDSARPDLAQPGAAHLRLWTKGLIVGAVGMVCLLSVAALAMRSGLTTPSAHAPEHAVIVHIPLTGAFGSEEEGRRLRTLGDDIFVALEKARSGYFDGDEWGQGELTLYLYGPNADRLFATVLPLLRDASLPAGSYATKRFGGADDPNVHVERVPLTARN